MGERIDSGAWRVWAFAALLVALEPLLLVASAARRRARAPEAGVDCLRDDNGSNRRGLHVYIKGAPGISVVMHLR